jgi:photosystem II stability/assembly factor-like uncharacterized protein
MSIPLYLTVGGNLAVRRDNGRWQLSSEMAGKDPHAVAADPARPERAYCGTLGHGLWRTDDAGRTWAPAGEGVPNAVSAVAVGGDGVVYAGTEPSAVFSSSDGGATWREGQPLATLPSAPTWRFPPRPETHHVRALAVDPTDPERVFACVEAGAFLRSHDGGRTWEDRRRGDPFDTHTLALHPRAPARLYGAAGDGFVRAGDGYWESRDGGASISHPDEGLDHQYLWGLAVDAGDPDTVLVSASRSPDQGHRPTGGESTIYRRTARDRWREVTAGLPPTAGRQLAVLVADPGAPGVFFAACNHGLFRSDDGGTSWESAPIT